MVPSVEADLESEADPQTVAPSHPGQRFPLIVVFTVSLAAVLHLAMAAWHYSVNILFWDQWDFYTPLFQNASFWRIFTWQHGPHREGIGLVLDKFVLEATRWSSRAEALFIVVVLFAAAAVALRLKQTLFGTFECSDIVVSGLLFLTFAQMEAVVGAANPSYSAVPLLLIALYCLAWLLPKAAPRYASVVGLNFLLIYAGFGFFTGIVTIAVLLFDLRSYPNEIRNAQFLRRCPRSRDRVAGGILLPLPPLGPGGCVVSLS